MIIINGRFLTQKISGVQRFAHEIIKELDEIVDKGKYKIIAPKNIINKDLKLKNIEIEIIGYTKGHLWEQVELSYYVKKNKGKLINLCNTAPILNPGVITIHDIQTKVHPEFFSKKFVFWYNLLHKFNIKNSDKLITVSEFSKNEILKYYNIPRNKIKVIYNGWQHMERIGFDEYILDKLKLKEKKYVLGVSSINPNKNFKYILELAKLHLEYIFVIVGNKNSKVFKENSFEELKNLKWTGYISDEELKTLYKNAEIFIFPSLYEGFGIPPLEAMACGCKNIVVSNTSCFPEIYGDNINYLNPREIKKLTFKKLKTEIVLKRYSWKRSSLNILNEILL